MSDQNNQGSQGGLSREKKLEILCKAGMMLRKELKKSEEQFGKDIRMKAYLCSAEALDQYDRVVEALSDKPKGEETK